ncbi:MAG: tRNA (adenosine(37)-N6)-dimethylallyltransferase MiaA [Cyanothece sp. SIO1E1]|nr:tRNA (adenosine(37)-N6)-dimethylallyltransferase MiaA [Cyanothece sp. SIO1E1]
MDAQRSSTIVPFLITICGPTATGKSSLALALAQRLSLAILSADSRQVYREFDIGTAKPSSREQQQIPHYLIDICAPIETLTLADYQQQAQSLINQLHNPGNSSEQILPLLVGGTGLYIRSLVKGLKIPRVAPQLALRSQLQTLGQSQCYAFLQQVDPIATQQIHSNDQIRTLRALEVFYASGRPISAQQGENPPGYPILQIGLNCNSIDMLKQRIAHRTAKMLAAGLVAEVESLCHKYGPDLPLLNTLGYQEIKQYLVGDISLDQAQQLTIQHTCQFAKRQRTWFRADSDITWFDADHPDLVDQVWQQIHQFLQEVAIASKDQDPQNRPTLSQKSS